MLAVLPFEGEAGASGPYSRAMTGSIDDHDAARFERGRQQFLEGLARLGAGEDEAAERHFRDSLREVPGRPSTLVNLAVALLRLGRAAEALEATGQVLALEPHSADALLHRAEALDALQRPQEALAAFAEAGRIGGLGAKPWFRHGQTLQQLKRDGEALRSYELALQADPGFAPAWTNKGNLLRELSRTEAAAEAFLQARACGGGDELNDYYLAAVGTGVTPRHAPGRYVQGLFDAYAEDFDHHIVDVLGYRAHEILARRLALQAQGRRFASALDLGCGTGLCGVLVKPAVERMTGVDLSLGMLEKARATGAYEALHHGELLHYLQSLDAAAQRHELVIAGDVFIYVGELAPVFAAVDRCLAPGGLFAFSVEEAPTGSEMLLQPTLRYAHSRAHVETLATTHGFAVLDAHRAPIRSEQRRAIEGLFFVLRKPG